MNLAGHSSKKYNSCIFMVNLRNSFFRRNVVYLHENHKSKEVKNKIITSFQVSPTVNKLLYDLKCLAILFVFVEMTGEQN